MMRHLGDEHQCGKEQTEIFQDDLVLVLPSDLDGNHRLLLVDQRVGRHGICSAGILSVLPVTTLVISVFIGRDESWSGSRWLMMLFFGVMYMLGPFATFSMANNLAFDHRNLPQLTDMLPGILCSAVGIGIGALIRRRKNKKGSIQSLSMEPFILGSKQANLLSAEPEDCGGDGLGNKSR